MKPDCVCSIQQQLQSHRWPPSTRTAQLRNYSCFFRFNLNSYTWLVATVLDSARDNTESHGANDLARECEQKRKGTPERPLILFRVLIEE